MPYLKNIPAVLGGNPEFPGSMPFAQPTLPDLDELTYKVRDAFRSKNITNNIYVRQFEEKAAEYLGVKHAVAVSSCTSGLMLVFRSLELEGEAIVPSFTFSATVQALVWNNLKPVFADCGIRNFNIDVNDAEGLINERTRAIVAVHVFGMPADIEHLENIAVKHGLKLIFDAAHAFGSLYHGRHVGCFGDAEVFSLSPTKLISAGEGGIVATNDGDLAGKIRIGRDYANPGNYDCQFPGLNARMTEFNAILGSKSLETIEAKVKNRNKLAKAYKAGLSGVRGIRFQLEAPGVRSTYKDLSIMISPDEFGLTRDELVKCVDAENIRTKKYYFPPVHRQRFCTSMFGFNGHHLPVTDHVSENILSLPIFSHMKEEEALGVCRAISRIYENRHEISALMRGEHEDKLLSSAAGVH